MTMFDDFELQISDVIYDNSLYVVPFLGECIIDRSIRYVEYEIDTELELNFDDEELFYETR
jgi:hypothetical protein